MAHDILSSSEKTSAIAQRTQAIVAINGSFFEFASAGPAKKNFLKALDSLGYANYSTVPSYALKVGTDLFSLSQIPTGIIGWKDNGQTTLFDSGHQVINLKINGQTLPVCNLNKLSAGKSTIFLPCYDHTTAKSNILHSELIIADGKIKEVKHKSLGGSTIPTNGFVFSYTNTRSTAKCFDVGDNVSFEITYKSNYDNIIAREMMSMDYIIGSTPLLIKDGEIVPYIKKRTSQFYTKRHPRTAIGIMTDGSWVLLVIDGRQKDSTGFTLPELAEFMKMLGCQHALNLDGGGSSTLAVNGKLINSPIGHEWALVKGERPISHALTIFSRN